ILAFLMMLVPGFPKLVFALLGLVLFAAAAWQYRYQFETLRKLFRVSDEELAASQVTEQSDEMSPPAPLQLDIAPSLAVAFGQEPVRSRIAEVARRQR